jgi:hypothetical protein
MEPQHYKQMAEAEAEHRTLALILVVAEAELMEELIIMPKVHTLLLAAHQQETE